MKHWEDLVLETAERFGGTFPHPETSADIAAVHQRAPNAVERAIDEVAADYSKGTINSPWGILRSRVQKITADVQAKATTANSREKALQRAEQWLKTAGLHYDRETEILDELFNDRGMLHPHDTPELRQRITDLWLEQRPKGEQVEAEHEAFMARYAEQRATIDHTPAPKTRSTEELKALALAKSLPVTHTIEETP